MDRGPLVLPFGSFESFGFIYLFFCIVLLLMFFLLHVRLILSVVGPLDPLNFCYGLVGCGVLGVCYYFLPFNNGGIFLLVDFV